MVKIRNCFTLVQTSVYEILGTSFFNSHFI
jgi:hypothetical protein